MRYLLLVSHGTFAPGLCDALGMIAGRDREDILCTSLLDGMDVDTYGKNLEKLLKPVTTEDEILLMGDLAAGSPLTKAAETLAKLGLLEKAVVIGGVNLSMAVTAAFADEDTPLAGVADEIMAIAREEIKKVRLDGGDSADDDEI